MTPLENLEYLTSSISNYLENNNSFDSIKNIVESYKGEDWKKYVRISNTKYYKEKIFEHPMYDVYIITWKSNQGALPHNHADNGCWLKMLQGTLSETIYSKSFEIIKTNILTESTIGFMNNKIGIHSINNNGDTIAVSLHIYSPPNFKTKYYCKI